MKSEFVLGELEKIFPDPKCELIHENAYQLIVAVCLSAQCTDKRVNIVTKSLFKKYPTVHDIAGADYDELRGEISSCGLANNKAKNLIEMAKAIVERFNGVVPSGQEDLESLAGVGRKTANVVRAVWFGEDTIAVDTHVFRVSNRLGLVKAKNVLECEKGLQKKFAKNTWSKLHYLLVLFGRYKCTARSPKCENCVFRKECKEGRKNVFRQSKDKD